MGLLRTDFCGRGELAERQQLLGQMLARIRRLSDEFNLAVVLTNVVISDPGGGAVFVNDPKKPAGGHVLAHACTNRLLLKKGRADQRIAKLVSGVGLPEAEASFVVSSDGSIAPYDE